MSPRLLFVSLLSILAIGGSSAQDAHISVPLAARVARGLQQSDLPTFLEASKKGPAEATEIGSAIAAAGNTRDPFWIPYLRPFLKNWKERNSNLSSLAGVAQIALAKLGDKQQLEEIGCEANFGSASIQDQALAKKLKYIQGWFSIQIAEGWISCRQAGEEEPPAPKPAGLSLGSPSFSILF